MLTLTVYYVIYNFNCYVIYRITVSTVTFILLALVANQLIIVFIP